jgi:hypothetical protein
VKSELAALRARNLRTLALLAALFLLPLVAAFCTYYGTPWRPARHLNHGALITPARPLPALALRALPDGAPVTPFHGKWSLVYVGDGACARECRDSLYVMRQTRLGLSQDMGRVQRVFLVTGGCCDLKFLRSEHAGLLLLDATGHEAAALLREFPQERADTLFVVDPLGNLMMRYDARSDPRGLREDLQQLLRLSQIG